MILQKLHPHKFQVVCPPQNAGAVLKGQVATYVPSWPWLGIEYPYGADNRVRTGVIFAVRAVQSKDGEVLHEHTNAKRPFYVKTKIDKQTKKNKVKTRRAPPGVLHIYEYITNKKESNQSINRQLF